MCDDLSLIIKVWLPKFATPPTSGIVSIRYRYSRYPASQYSVSYRFCIYWYRPSLPQGVADSCDVCCLWNGKCTMIILYACTCRIAQLDWLLSTDCIRCTVAEVRCWLATVIEKISIISTTNARIGYSCLQYCNYIPFYVCTSLLFLWLARKIAGKTDS